MAQELFAILWAPFLMCLVLTGIHAYLGVHVLAREVVFVDIALAQIAALGATAAFLLGYEMDTWQSYAYGLSATLAGALVLALTRSRRRHVSQEAVIGVVYAVSSAAAVLLSDRAPHGAEQVRTMLVGNLLAVRPPEVAEVAALYACVGLLHWFCRRPFVVISTNAAAAFEQGWNVRVWDFLFYASFGVVVTSSVRIAGVLLVFSYLIVPALAGAVLGVSIASRLLIGWGFGTLVSVLGVTASAALDLPTGATVVCAFGFTLVAGWGLVRLTGWWPATGRASRRRGVRALGAATLGALALAGATGCAGLAPPAIRDAGDLAGVWRGRLSGPRGNADATMTMQADGAYTGTMYLDGGDRELKGFVTVVRGRARYLDSSGAGRVVLEERGGRPVLRFVGDGGGAGGTFVRER